MRSGASLMSFPFAPRPERKPTEPDQIEGEEELSDIERIAADKVLTFRAKTLADYGFTPHQARALALNKDVDIRWVINELIKKGCDVDTAFDIAS